MPISKRIKQIKAEAQVSLQRLDSLIVEIDRSMALVERWLFRSKVRPVARSEAEKLRKLCH
jgi:hypothetical protein